MKKLKTINLQEFVVIEHRVQVFNPLRIDIPVKDDPLPLVDFTADVIDDLAQNVREQTVCPFARVWIEHTVQSLWKWLSDR